LSGQQIFEARQRPPIIVKKNILINIHKGSEGKFKKIRSGEFEKE